MRVEFLSGCKNCNTHFFNIMGNGFVCAICGCPDKGIEAREKKHKEKLLADSEELKKKIADFKKPRKFADADDVPEIMRHEYRKLQQRR